RRARPDRNARAPRSARRPSAHRVETRCGHNARRRGATSISDIRVVVVDDHAVVRSGLRLLLDREPDIAAVDEAATAAEALFRVIEHKPDVLLIDVTMPGTSGIEAIPKLLEASPGTKVLVLSMHDD